MDFPELPMSSCCEKGHHTLQINFLVKLIHKYETFYNLPGLWPEKIIEIIPQRVLFVSISILKVTV